MDEINQGATPFSWLAWSKAKTWSAVAVIVVAGVAAYSNSLHGPFIFDDVNRISKNESIRSIWRLDDILLPSDSQDYYRPFLNLSLALCYSVGGLNVAPFHVLNLGIHILAALAVFGLVRRTLLLPQVDARFGKASTLLAMVISLLWMLHPLQTESVTYVIQRCEALMGLFIVLAIYCVLRGAESSHPKLWYVCAVTACAMGMGSKEVMAMAPFLVLLYDRVFLAHSLREAFKKRWGLYLGLALTSIILLPAIRASQLHHADAAVESITVWEYARTQFGVVVHYLRLSAWPDTLCLDYGWPIATSTLEIIPPAIVIGVLLLATLWALWRSPGWGFVGASFFAALAPSSSLIPIHDLAFEHRMYLPLAPLVTAVVLGGYVAGRRLRSSTLLPWPVVRVLGVCLAIATATALGILTYLRNEDYRSDVRIWQDTVAKAPNNPRAHNNLGNTLVQQSRVDEAIVHYQTALEVDPNNFDAHSNLGAALAQQGRVDEVIAHYRKSLELDPNDAQFCHNLGIALVQCGRVGEAIAHYQKALETAPNDAQFHHNLAHAMFQEGRIDEAITHYQKALELSPNDATAHSGLGIALVRRGKIDEGIVQYEKALEIDRNFGEAYNNLGNALVQQGRASEAIVQYQKALEINPNDAQFHHNLASALVQQGGVDEAIVHYQEGLKIEPNDAVGHSNLGNALAQRGRVDEAIAHCQEALEIRRGTLGEKHPTYVGSLINLAWLYHNTGDSARAGRLYRQALEVNPNDAQAHYFFGLTLHQQGKDQEALDHWREALRVQPDQVVILLQSAWVLATSPDASVRNGDEAIALAERAVQLSNVRTLTLLDTLAAAYAEAGRFSEAAQTAQQALEMVAATNAALARALGERVKLYRAGSAFRAPRESAVHAPDLIRKRQ